MKSLTRFCLLILALLTISCASYAKEAVLRGLDGSLAEGMRIEADLSFILQTTDDRREGIRAFLEKRKPEFHGR